MPDIIPYIKQLQAKGYSNSQIRTWLLRSYPADYVDRLIPQKKQEHKPEHISISKKIIGILFTPKKLFVSIKGEDMIHSVNIYACTVLLISIFLFSAVALLGSSIPQTELLGTFGFNVVSGLYFILMYLSALLSPFLVSAYYYLMLKWMFRMDGGFEPCHTAVTYGAIQAVILGIILIPLMGGLFFALGINGLLIGLGLYLIILIYNLYTLIRGLAILGEVSTLKAAVPVLLPIILVLIVVMGMYTYVQSLISSSVPLSFPTS